MKGLRRLLRLGETTATASVALAALACVLVAPRHHDKDLRRRWDELSRYRFAHRGLHRNGSSAPENSLAAFRLAWERGYGSELDVRLSADGQVVVVHDSSLSRACGVEGQVEQTPFDELRALRLFGSEERIPLLAEVLDVYERGAGPHPPLIVEIKTTSVAYAELCDKTLDLLDAHDVVYCVESFDPRVLFWLRRRRPDVIRGQLSERFALDDASDLSRVKGALAAALVGNVAGRPDFVAYRFEHRLHPAVRLVCGVLGAWRVYWTVDNEDDLREADREGAVSIFEGFAP